MTKMAHGLISQGLLLALAMGARAALYDQVIETKYGAIQGYAAFNSSPQADITNWADITVWKGIPFGANTSGENRWKPPQPIDAWNATLYASDYGDICPDSNSNYESLGYTMSEDCLNLNIWSAANSTDAKLPVVMWSYPAESTARDPLFDGGGMADKGVVFVNYNYRTGAMGWLALPELSDERYAEVGVNSSGNYGMLDQFAAVKWIHENIAAFGGDPDHITVMGQSAGSAATYHIVNSPLTAGLIVGAIIESGVRDPHDPLDPTLAEGYTNLTVSLETGEEFLEEMNVNTLAELRTLSLDTLISTSSGAGAFGGGSSTTTTTGGGPGASGNDTTGTGGGSSSTMLSFSATLDGYAMPLTYAGQLAAGPANDVPILTGNTRDESGATYGLNITVAEYEEDEEDTYGSTWATKFIAAYGAANDSASASAAYNAQWTDRSKVGTWLWSQLWKQNATSPVYNYYWDHAPPGQTSGAYHESEINYVLNNLYDTDLPWEDDDYEIAAKMNGYWVNFIKTGSPNGGNLTFWPAANENQTVQHVGDGWGQVPLASDDQVRLFKSWFATLEAY